ncbi:HLA class II histocompatibility antigen, DP beta 1 chain-like [Tupaia chinensis]|uniref:HLA class II histocompatibility antigen, DP beta 1 chain-like n=1 Tax=Tupaia chinensis TaxID=246437 RepID=UPI000FFCC340|nr:HLA class II histocompatibility antigen, DP beta 1 chain-like [Tupaia chinensis]
MMVLQAPEAPWTTALMSLLVLLNLMVQVKATPGEYVYQFLMECSERNGTRRYVLRYVYNREEFIRLDSDVGEFQAVTALGRPTVDLWNHQKGILEQARAEADTECRHIYELYELIPPQRRGERPGSPGEVQAVAAHRTGRGAWGAGEGGRTQTPLTTPDTLFSKTSSPGILDELPEAQSDSARTKMLTGVGGFVLGLTSLVASFVLHLRSQRASQGS